MLPRRQRLTRHTFPDTRRLRRVSSLHFSVSLGPVSVEEGGCAVVVPKKVAKLSAARHLLKRRIMGVLREYAVENQVIVVYARPGSISLSYAEVSSELHNLLTKEVRR